MGVWPFDRQSASPGRLDPVFGILAGLYAGTLVLPALLQFVSVDVLTDGDVLFQTVWLVAGGSVLLAAVLTRWTGAIDWVGTTRLAWLAPLAAGSLAAYHALGLLGTDPSGTAVGTAIHVVGFPLEFVAAVLGVVLVAVARVRRLSALVDENEVAAEWRAGWPKQRRFAVRIAATAVFVVPLLVVLITGGRLPFAVVLLSVPVVAVTSRLGSEWTYRATPAGLERRRFGSVQLLGWDQFEGFRVTDRAVVLHRSLPDPDVRWSRWETAAEDPEVLAALEEYLDRVE